MVVIPEGANVRECSSGSQPDAAGPFRTSRQMTFVFDVSVRTSRMRLCEIKGVQGG